MPAVIFDLFGTLIDLRSDEEAHIALSEELAKLHGNSFSPKEHLELYRSYESQGMESLDAVMEALRRLSKEKGFKLRIDRDLVDRLHVEAHVRHVYPVPGARKAVLRAKEACGRVAVVSDADDRVAKGILEKLGLLELLDTVVTSGAMGVRKPDPRLFLEAARRLGVEPGSCVVIGDTWRDVKGARRSGMRVVLVDRGGYQGPEPDAKAPSLLQAVEIALSLLRCGS